jgi:hypothetical protein
VTARRLLRVDALMVCTHELGKVGLAASQRWVRVTGVPLLVDDDPEGRPIAGCPNLTAVTKPCTKTLQVRQGYSTLVRIDGRAVCLDTLQGMTDGQGGVYRYKVNDPGQRLVAEVDHSDGSLPAEPPGERGDQ